MTKRQAMNRYSLKKFDSEVVEYMEQIIDSLISEYGSVRDEFIISLDILAKNQQLYTLAYNDIMSRGMIVKDARGNDVRNCSISTINNIQAYQHKILNSFGMNITSKSKLKGGSDAIDTGDSFIEDLTK